MALSNDEKRILAQTLLGEAGGEGLQGMMAVAHVIKNRAGSGRFPSDPVSVALQPKQFSTWNSGQGGNNPGRYGPGSPGYAQALQAVEAVFDGNAPDPTGGATHYWSPSGMRAMGYASDPYWARSEATPAGRVQIGNHVFLAQRPPPTALDAVNAMGGAPTAPTPPQRPAGLAYVPPPPPPLPRTDPRLPSARIDALAGAVPAAVLPRLNDADINERAIDTYGPDPQGTSPTQDMWREYTNWLEQSTPSTPSARGGRNVPDLPNIPGTPAQRGSVRPAPQMPYSEAVMGSLNNRLTSGVMDPATDMTPFNAIFDQYQPQEVASAVPPMPRSDPRRLQGWAPVPFPWPDDLPTPPVDGIPSMAPVPSSTVTIADLPPLPGAGQQVASAPVPPMRPAGLGANNGLPPSAAPGTILRGADGKNYQYAETSGMQGANGSSGWIETSLPSTPPTAPVQVAAPPQVPVPPQRPPMATYAGQTTGGNPVEAAGQFLGDFQNNGGLLGMGLNLLTGRGLFPGDQGVIPQFKQGVLDRMEELGPKRGDVLSGIFSRRVGETPTFSRDVPQSGPFSAATAVGPGGSESGFLSGRTFQPRGSTYDANVRRANMDALRGVEGRTMREKIDNAQRSGRTLYKAG